jgi:hypothetical protein
MLQACSSTQNKKSFTRAMHMKCVLDGKSLGKCGAGKPPTVTKTSFSKLTCAATTVGSIKPCHAKVAAATTNSTNSTTTNSTTAPEKVAAAKAKADDAEGYGEIQARHNAKGDARRAAAAKAKVAAAKAKAAEAEAKAAEAEAKAAKLAAAAKVAAAKAKAAKKGFKDCNQYTKGSKSRCGTNDRLSSQRMWALYVHYGGRNGGTTGTLEGKKCAGRDDLLCNCQYKCQKTKLCKSYDVRYAGGGDKECILFKKKCSRTSSSDGVGGGVCRDSSINGGVDQYQ